ncbi:MAG: DNA-3-methyladenine glycosylase [Gemmatimonadetes bacterium]|jgi:DNA-3-methyladenine glycosylase II|nr:DNA-3-methyladenine glycosylase [Gemmatimonadota bacterium]|tara:strand:- start:253 stop:879 length:627 start_codon:yes stop_codon:yes gene_type:complete
MTKKELARVWVGGYKKLKRDPAFGPWVRCIGSIHLPVSDVTPFFYLVRAICHQQLAGKAARTIHGRFIEAVGHDVSPENVLCLPESTLRAAGLSGNKLGAIRDLATKIQSGELEVHDLEMRSDEEIVSRLTLVKGIGEWTAHMYLMFRLHRPDVWPVGDLAVRAGYARVQGMAEDLSKKELRPLGDPYRPWRSAAAWYCYRALETELT